MMIVNSSFIKSQKAMIKIQDTAERKRLIEDSNRTKHWKKWGPYLSDRQWGTVREDYSADGNAWDYFSHDQSRSRAYRWGEDGIMGISDNHQRLCFAIALWNGKDAILKERLFGLTNSEGNHGEDVKEYYFYLDSTPTHSYMKGLYKYPHNAFPYEQLIQENGRRKREDSRAFEFELMDTGIFDEDRYFDVFVEYAKNSPEDILIEITVVNRGPEAKELHLAPTLWFRNTWSWGKTEEPKPALQGVKSSGDFQVVKAEFTDLKSSQPEVKKWLYCQTPKAMLYTENETNNERFGWGKNTSYVKDGINDYIVNGQTGAVNHQQGTKVSPYYHLNLAPGETKVVRLRLSDIDDLTTPFGSEFTSVFAQRKSEADQFYQAVTPYEKLSPEMRNVQRQAFAGMLWSKQFFHYVVQDWINGDPGAPAPPPQRKNSGRNSEWTHLFNEDIISMPDKWEYPWFAAWDLAFHTIPLALIDPEFAKKQLYLFTREWFMHPNGQIPAYEWNFSDVNPPVHAWAAWRVYKIEEKMYGNADHEFLEQLFQKLSLYFTWWINRKDVDGNNLFGGGFLGLDNIGVFDRSNLKISGASIEQADGTSWMGMFCLNLLKMATELTKINRNSKVYDDMASKYFQHFLLIAEALNKLGGTQVNIWDNSSYEEGGGFFYDILKVPANALEGGNHPFSFSMKVRSMVGLIPLFAVEMIDQDTLNKYLSSDFRKRADWFLANRPDLTDNIYIDDTSSNLMEGGLALSLVSPARLKLILKRMLDEAEFLGDYGIRALSKSHQPPYPYTLPFAIRMEDGSYEKPVVEYEPGESRFGLFGGNSNWRGPIWMPVNFLIIESLQKFHYYLGDDFKVEYPSGSGKMMNLWEVSTAISQRLINIFLPKSAGNSERPVYGGTKKFQEDPNWNQYILFYEYFHGDNGAGIGASHQTGWTGVVAKLIQQHGSYTAQGKSPE